MMRAMTCRGAMLVTLLLVATAASTLGARESLADRFRAAQGRSLDSVATSDDVTEPPVALEDGEEQSTNAPEEELEWIVEEEEEEKSKAKQRNKPKNSLMQRTRNKMNRLRAQSRYGADNRPRNGVRPTRIRLTPKPRTTTTLPPRRRYTPQWRQRQRTTKSTSTLEPINISTEPQPSINTTQTTPSTNTLDSLTTSTETQSSIPTIQTTRLTTTLRPRRRFTHRPRTTTTLHPRRRYTPQWRQRHRTTKPTSTLESINISIEPQQSLPKVQITTSTTALKPINISIESQTITPIVQTTTPTTTIQSITNSNEQKASLFSLFSTNSTTLATTQMTTTTTETESTYPTEISEAITFTTPADSQSSATPLTSKIRFIPRLRLTTTLKPKNTTGTTLQTIINSTEQIFTEDYSENTENTDTPEDFTLTTPTDSQSPLNKVQINTDDSLTTITTTATTTTSTTTTTTERSITTTDSFPSTEAISQEIQTTEETGHAGEVFLVEEKDIPNLKIPKPLKKPLIPKPVIVGSGLSVGAGINIKDPDVILEQVGPVLITGNSLRKRRQHHTGDNIIDQGRSLPTDDPAETTINPFNDGFDENDFETTLGPISFNRRTSTASPTTLDESPQDLSDASATTIDENPDPQNNLVIETANDDSSSDFQEITVGTKVNLRGPGRRPVTGEVIPVELRTNSELEMEHKSEGGIVLNSENEDGQSTLVSDRPERPGSSSILGSLLNYFTQSRPERPERPSRPRPDRPQVLRTERPVTQSGERPFRPFRPRPRPSNNRPDILPPRLSSRPNIPEINSDSATNRPTDTTIFPEDSPDELPSRSTAVPVRASIFRQRPSSLLPSKPVIESGFQGIPGEDGESRPAVLFRPGAEEPNDFEYEEDALPPSLPNLKIIPFVADDAITPNQEGNIDSVAGNDFRLIPQDKPVTTTAKPITTERSTRRPLPIGTRRPSIVPPRRPLRPDGNRPSIFRPRPRPGQSTRRPFIPPRTTPKDRIESEENKIAPSTSSPFRLRFTSERTTEKAFTPFTLPSVEKTTKLVQSEPEEDITTDDIPSTESIPVTPPEEPPRLPGPIISTETPLEIKIPSRLPDPIRPIRPFTTSSQSSSVSSSSSKPRPSSDISGVALPDGILQDIFGRPEGTTRAPEVFVPPSKKPVILKKTPAPLPAIPSLITNQFPLAPDAMVAQGLLKLSGCNIYGRMYQVDDRIKELSAECKECRCTPVGVQCLPVCA